MSLSGNTEHCVQNTAFKMHSEVSGWRHDLHRSNKKNTKGEQEKQMMMMRKMRRRRRTNPQNKADIIIRNNEKDRVC
jgi:hypothetical protein